MLAHIRAIYIPQGVLESDTATGLPVNSGRGLGLDISSLAQLLSLPRQLREASPFPSRLLKLAPYSAVKTVPGGRGNQAGGGRDAKVPAGQLGGTRSAAAGPQGRLLGERRDPLGSISIGKKEGPDPEREVSAGVFLNADKPVSLDEDVQKHGTFLSTDTIMELPGADVTRKPIFIGSDLRARSARRIGSS
ncbi:hypothetical protein DL767_001600 [Monosporascus sp. MG133]|nr:hypothetical protein DL767_001600 [Monosporascus sp. MG133]